MTCGQLRVIAAAFLIAGSAAFGGTLTSITLDPEDASGTTTNAPGAWSTNPSDPLSQLGVVSGGAFLNHAAPGFDLGEISIELVPGVNTFDLYANHVLPGNPFYGAILFFDGSVLPQIAVYNTNGGTGPFLVQAAGTNVMCSANGGAFFCPAPGSAVYTAPDGSSVEVLGFTIDSTSSGTDLISGVNIGSDGIADTTAQLTLRYNRVPEPGTLGLAGAALLAFLRRRS
jgi:hypothetical protein